MPALWIGGAIPGAAVHAHVRVSLTGHPAIAVLEQVVWLIRPQPGRPTTLAQIGANVRGRRKRPAAMDRVIALHGTGGSSPCRRRC
jgi:hypothetical protein